VEQHQFRVIRARLREIGKILSNRSDQAGLPLHALVISHHAKRIADPESARIAQVLAMSTSSRTKTFHCSLDLLDVVILSVLPVIGVASYMALRVTGKRDARDIVLDEERFRTQG
jgi:hypothetical protein